MRREDERKAAEVDQLKLEIAQLKPENPPVNFLWLSGLLVVLGSVVAMWPDAREHRRLAARFAGDGGAVARA